MTDHESITLAIQMLMKTGKLTFNSMGQLAFVRFEGKYRGLQVDMVHSGADLQDVVQKLLTALKYRKD